MNDPGRVSYSGVTLKFLISKAYSVYADQVLGPDWLSTERYNIDATVSGGATPAQVNLMLQNLLAERFGLVLHHETKDADRFELSVANGGPKLSVAAAASAREPEGSADSAKGALREVDLDKDGCPVLPPGQRATVVRFGLGKSSCAVFRMVSMFDLVRMLENALGMESGGAQAHVVDRTGIDGQYDLTLRFTITPIFPGAPAVPLVEGRASDPTGSPSLPVALEKQLGLKLTKRRGPLSTLVIDHALKIPTEN
jgi:uncharacterized protein (TIGR03435 family)